MRAGPAAAAAADYASDAHALRPPLGPTHTEVYVARAAERPAGSARSAPLVEANARWHAASTAPLTDGALGFNAIDATADALLDGDAFDALLARPPAALAVGARIVHLVSAAEGVVRAVRLGRDAEALVAALPTAIDALAHAARARALRRTTIDNDRTAAMCCCSATPPRSRPTTRRSSACRATAASSR